MNASEILDFIYLDLPRLESFGSQLLEGLPESRTRSDEKTGEVTGAVSGGLPLVVKGTAGTRGVLSASSSVVSRDHHRLVVMVIEQLRERRFLHDLEDDLPDGSFVLMNGHLQIADPALIGRFFGSAGDLQKAVEAFEHPETTAAGSTQAERRAAHRKRQVAAAEWPLPQQTRSLKTLLDFFAADTVRIRLLLGGETAAVGVVEMLEAMKGLTSAGTEGLSVTPLAIYRTIAADSG